MKKYFVTILFLFCIFVQYVHAQQKSLETLNKETLALFKQKKYDEAIELSQKALAISKEKFGDEHIETTRFLNNLGVLLIVEGNYQQAKSKLEKAFAIRKNVLELEKDTIETMYNLAVFYAYEGNYQKSSTLAKMVTMYHKNKVISQTLYGSMMDLYNQKQKYPMINPLLNIRNNQFAIEPHNIIKALESLKALYEKSDDRTQIQQIENYIKEIKRYN